MNALGYSASYLRVVFRLESTDFNAARRGEIDCDSRLGDLLRRYY